MIPNIVVPMPIHARGNADSKIMMAFIIVVAIVSVLLIVGGFIYDGVKHNKWTMRADPEIPDGCGYLNFAKTSGYFTLFSEITIIMLIWLIKIVYNVL